MIPDIHLAKVRHLQWRFKLSTLLLGTTSLTNDEIVSHHDCNLGKWLYSEGLDKYGHLPLMQELEQVHKTLHEIIGQTVRLINSGKDQEAQRAYDEMEPVSDKIMELLDELSGLRLR